MQYLILNLFVIFFGALSLHLNLPPDETRCIGQELDQEDTAVFRVGAAASKTQKDNDRKLIAKVRFASNIK
jgi:hypothetical protein